MIDLRNVLAAVLLAGASAAAAQAADLPEAASPVPQSVPAYNWSGFYVGGHVGGLFNGKKDGDKYDFDGDDIYDFDNDDDDGDKEFLAGGQVGVNYQMGAFVVGVEGDFSYFGFGDDDKDEKWRFENEDGDVFNLGYHDGGSNWLATVRGRVGATFDRFLVYATGGVAFSDLEGRYFYDADNHDDDDDVTIGWTVGAGVEGFITPNITAKIEYLYVNFELDDEEFNYNSVKLDAGSEVDAHLIRAGLNFKFGGF